MTNWVNDVRHALRTLAKSPGFAAVTLLTLALGIGANTAIFSVVHAVLLSPLPYPEPARLYMAWESRGESRRQPVSVPNFVDWRARSKSFAGMSVYHDTALNLTGTEQPDRLRGGRVNASFFTVLGVPAAVGRTFAPNEDQPGAQRVAILSDEFWSRRFQRSPAVLNTVLRLDGEAYTVVGVLPPKFRFHEEEIEIWVPAFFSKGELESRGGHFLGVIARLKDGVTPAQAQQEMDSIAADLAKQYPNDNEGRGVALLPLEEELVGSLRKGMFVLLGAVGLVLLIACADVANLLLARATSRQREVAVRLALGASRARIMGQLLTESLVLAIAGGALGVLFNAWMMEALVAMIPAEIPRVQEISMSGAVLGFAAGLSAVTGLVFGLAPALLGSRADLQETLKEGGRGTAAGRHRLRSVLVVSEVALSLVLLVGAGLLLRSFYRLQHVHPGFERAGRLVFNVSLPDNRYVESKAWDLFFEKALANVSALPGVQNAALGVNLPVTGIQIRLGMVRVEQASGPRANRTAPQYHAISPGYFRTLGMPLVRGREFDPRDRHGAPNVAIVSEALVHKYFAKEDPLGKRVILGYGNDATGDAEIAYEIVGVVGNVRHSGPQREPDPEIYTPFAQTPWSFGQFVVKTSAPTGAVLSAAREAIAAVDKDVPLARIRTMDDLMAETVAQERFRMTLLVVFAGLAVTLAAVGIYGVMAYSVTQRTSEIGIRMALGANTGNVLGMVLRQGMTLTLAGVGLGLAGALAGARALSSHLEPLLFQVRLNDAATYAGVAAVLTLVALAACWIPARRATRVDPMVALRYE